MPEKGNYTFVSRLGWVYALGAAALAVIANLLFNIWLAIPFWLVSGVSLYLFRDPHREIPSLPLAIVSPADGVIVSVEDTEDPYIKRPAICITVQMSFWGTYITRSPTEGKVIERWFRAPHEQKDSTTSAASYGLWIQTDEEDDLVLVMNRHSNFSVPRCYVQSGERIGQGQRCGLIRFGTDLQLYVPVNCKIGVKAGDEVRAGEDVLATIVHK